MTRVEPEKLRSDAKYPWARDAEKFIAGAALRGGAVLDDARRAITAEHFGDAWYRAVFQTCCELADSSRPVDMATVFLHLKQQGVLREYGKDAIDIHEVFESAHPGGVDYYAALALDASKRRRLIAIAEQLIEECLHDGDPASDLAADAENRISAAVIDPTQYDPVSLGGDCLSEGIDDLLRRADRMRPRVWSGIQDLDDILGGFDPGQYIVIGARPSVGKSALGLRIAMNVGMSGNPCYFVSLEMGRAEIGQRAAFMTTGLSGFAFRSGRRTQEDVHRLGESAKDQLAGVRLWLDDTPSMKVEHIAAAARRIKRQHGLRLLVVDYLQLVSPTSRGDRREQVEHVSRSMKKLARELQVPVLALAQLNREIESRGESKPRMSDLREAGGIEQDADVVALLWNLPGRNDSDPVREVGCAIAKHRNGPTGEITLDYHRACMRFDNHFAGGL